jgi:hypothetical protein
MRQSDGCRSERVPMNTENATTTILATAQHQSRSMKSRRLGRIAGLVVGTTLALTAAATSASALSPYVTTASKQAGDCIVTAGARYDGPRGWAIGAGTITCTKRHASTTATVHLLRNAGSGWAEIPGTAKSATFTNSFGFGTRELDTAPVCGGGGAWWVTEVDYQISGAGTGYVQNAAQWYAPNKCV